MRTLNECFPRTGAPCISYREEGRGLGFSIGGWHPFQISTYLPTLKKLDPLANTSIGKLVWKPIEKVNQTVNKDFAKAKVWSQDHRKQLQIAAAVAATMVGGAYALGYLGTSGAGAAAAGAGEAAAAGEAVTATTYMAPELLAPLAPTAGAEMAAVSFAPATVGSVGTVASLAPLAGGSSGVGSIFSTVGSVAKDSLSLLALSKALGGGQAQQQQAGPDYSTMGGYGSAWGQQASGGGGGGPLGPVDWMGNPTTPENASTLPPWLIPAGIVAGILFLTSE